MSAASFSSPVLRSQASGPNDVLFNMELTNGNVSPDGVDRPAVLVNGITPGPIISATKGQDMYITVDNKLTDSTMRKSTSVYWHGILQPKTAYDDGPASVTQCPIPPGHSYQYKLETGTQAGTFWYHSHLSSQYVDGLRGAMIVRDPEDKITYGYDEDDDSTVISLNDWYHESSQTLGHAWLDGKAGRFPPQPKSALFNGVGRVVANDTSIPWPVIKVQKDKKYRLRLINMSATLTFNFGIEGHTLTVIEVDGVKHEKLDTSSVFIAAGQRYSVILNANGDSTRNYWIANDHKQKGIAAYAILRYQDAEEVDPTTALPFRPDDTYALEEHKLVSSVDEAIPLTRRMVVPLVFRFEYEENKKHPRYYINDITYPAPDVPTLLEILNDPTKVTQSSFDDEDVIYLPRDATIDLRIQGSGGHPFHLHGHRFQVVRSANGVPDPTKNLPVRDTVMTNGLTGDDAVTVRFRTDNAGPWFFHCHKIWHLEAGLAVVFAVDPEGMRDEIKPSQAWKDLCDIYKALPDEDKM